LVIRKGRARPGRRGSLRSKKRIMKFNLSADTVIDYKDLALVQKFVTERGKILSRRITGLTAKQQRAMLHAIQRDRYLGLVPVGSSKRRHA